MTCVAVWCGIVLTGATEAASPRGAGPPAAPAPSRSTYVGSEACRSCHTEIYDLWRTTRHSYSILTSEQARQAGFPLPEARRGGNAPSVTAWKDVSYVIGGQQRVTYVDRTGTVLPTSFDHRRQEWNAFPSQPVQDCVPCHFTGVGAGPVHPDDAIFPGRWAEMNIGCEACHGPGGRHMATYAAEDILVDASSRTCGECHTEVNRVLPPDDLHAAHDTVQVWNHDRHATGMPFHSFSAQCATCHSPYRGMPPSAAEHSHPLVFSEEKHNISCIGCHNPHALTDPHYKRERATLDPPIPNQRHVLLGTDHDFATLDYLHMETNEQVCLHCHKGADRIELDHAHASCTDCHVVFHRSRGVEARVLHDANHDALSCRPCHQDADHLLTILYRDPVFLEPKHVHDLRRLPGAAVSKYGLAYPRLARRRPHKAADSTDPSDRTDHDGRAVDAPPDSGRGVGVTGTPVPEVTPPRKRLRAELQRLFSGSPHAELAATDATVRMLQDAVREQPFSLALRLRLASSYLRSNQAEAASHVLDGDALASPWIVLDLGFAKGMVPAALRVAQRVPAPWPIPEEDRLCRLFVEPAQPWIRLFLLLLRGEYEAVLTRLDELDDVRRVAPVGGLYRGLAQIGLHAYRDATETLQAAIGAEDTDAAVRTALVLAYAKRARLSQAREVLDPPGGDGQDDPVALYVLATGLFGEGKYRDAAAVVRRSLALDPEFAAGRFLLARTHIARGEADPAIAVYEGIIAEDATHLDAHRQLGNLHKLISDQLRYRVYSAGESAPHPTETVANRTHRSATWDALADRHAGRALGEYTIALGLRPAAPVVLYQVAELDRRAGRLARALRLFERLSEREPTVWLYPYRAGTVLIQMARPKEAVARLQASLELAPTEGDIYVALGFARARLREWDRAVEILEAGAIHQPFSPALYNNLGAAYASQGDLDRAVRALHRALDLGTFPLPRRHLTLTNLGLAYFRQHRRQDAETALRSALHQYPADPLAADLLRALRSDSVGDGAARLREQPFVFNDLLELFGEVSTVSAIEFLR